MWLYKPCCVGPHMWEKSLHKIFCIGYPRRGDRVKTCYHSCIFCEPTSGQFGKTTLADLGLTEVET